MYNNLCDCNNIHIVINTTAHVVLAVNSRMLLSVGRCCCHDSDVVGGGLLVKGESGGGVALERAM